MVLAFNMLGDALRDLGIDRERVEMLPSKLDMRLCQRDRHAGDERALFGADVEEGLTPILRRDRSCCDEIRLTRKARLAMATIPGTLLLAISSPYARRGTEASVGTAIVIGTAGQCPKSRPNAARALLRPLGYHPGMPDDTTRCRSLLTTAPVGALVPADVPRAHGKWQRSPPRC